MEAGINGGLAIWNLFLAYAGALNAEIVGRRKLWLISSVGMLVSYIVLTGLSVGIYHTAGTIANSSIRAVLQQHTFDPLGLLQCLGYSFTMVFMILAGHRFHVRTYDPNLQIETDTWPVSYGAEILPYHMRLKGLSILLSVQSIGQAFVRMFLLFHSRIADNFSESMGESSCACIYYVEIVSLNPLEAFLCLTEHQ